jgi:parvulin-like peptidyl-prolyl isomerase
VTRTARVVFGTALVSAAGLAACRTEAPAPDASVAAQVGDAFLTETEVARAIAAAPGLDSAEARRETVEPWVRRQLLAQHARATGLADEPDVRQRLVDAERAVLEAAALGALADESAPTDAQIEAAYAAHPGDFTPAEAMVRVRHLLVRGPGRARAAAAALARVAASAQPDSTFALAAREFSTDADGAVSLARTFVTLSELDAADPALGRAVAGLAPGAVAMAAASRPGTVHVVALVARHPAGAVLPLAAVRDEIAERLGVGLRTDAAARLVERLRADAVARSAYRVR